LWKVWFLICVYIAGKGERGGGGSHRLEGFPNRSREAGIGAGFSSQNVCLDQIMEIWIFLAGFFNKNNQLNIERLKHGANTLINYNFTSLCRLWREISTFLKKNIP
jgi:hypothetical protein